MGASSCGCLQGGTTGSAAPADAHEVEGAELDDDFEAGRERGSVGLEEVEAGRGRGSVGLVEVDDEAGKGADAVGGSEDDDATAAVLSCSKTFSDSDTRLKKSS
jgi:hypothetical protein